MENGVKRSYIPSILALAKRQLVSVLNNLVETKIFNVKLSNETKYQEYLGRITNKVDTLTSAIKAYAAVRENQEPPTVNVRAVTEESIDAILAQLQSAIYALQGKEFVFPEMHKIEGKVEVTNQKELPKIQEVKGGVKITNPSQLKSDYKKELDSIVRGLEDVRQAIGSIKVPKQSEIKIPSMPKQFSISEGKQLLKSLEELSSRIEDLPGKIKIPKSDFPSSISVDNFPPQHIPTPVTHMSINGLRGFVRARSVTVSTTATPLPGQVQSNRRSLLVYNNSAVTVEIGGSTMSFGEGLPIAAGTFSPVIDAGDNMIMYGVVSTGTANVRTLELSDERLSGH